MLKAIVVEKVKQAFKFTCDVYFSCFDDINRSLTFQDVLLILKNKLRKKVENVGSGFSLAESRQFFFNYVAVDTDGTRGKSSGTAGTGSNLGIAIVLKLCLSPIF